MNLNPHCLILETRVLTTTGTQTEELVNMKMFLRVDVETLSSSVRYLIFNKTFLSNAIIKFAVDSMHSLLIRYLLAV